MEYGSLILALPHRVSLEEIAKELQIHTAVGGFSGSSHPDVVVLSPIEKKTTITIQQVRELFARASFRPVLAQKTSILFFPAESLSLPAQHALLKILEEPPANTQLILITHTPYALLPTILSRCSIVPLKISSEYPSVSQVSFPSSIAESLQASDAYTTRDSAVSYMREVLATLTEDVQRDRKSQQALLHARHALGLLEKNCSVKLVLDSFFFALL